VKEEIMFDNEMFRAIARGMQRQIEREMIREIRSIRQDLLLLSQQDRIAELEQSEWARLEPVE
jgi:hypothetical protein